MWLWMNAHFRQLNDINTAEKRPVAAYRLGVGQICSVLLQEVIYGHCVALRAADKAHRFDKLSPSYSSVRPDTRACPVLSAKATCWTGFVCPEQQTVKMQWLCLRFPLQTTWTSSTLTGQRQCYTHSRTFDSRVKQLHVSRVFGRQLLNVPKLPNLTVVIVCILIIC